MDIDLQSSQNKKNQVDENQYFGQDEIEYRDWGPPYDLLFLEY